MTEAHRLARRRLLNGLGAFASIVLFITVMLTIVILPGILSEDATTLTALRGPR